MHILVVNFNLEGISYEEYQAHCQKVAPVFKALPGLISKVWLADPATNTFGGVYTWQSQEAMEAYTASEIFQKMATHPNFANVTARKFGILEGPTEVTRGLALAVPG